jgi:phenylpropionate dioxygenase-like ring-hydroxylating dioxygenase large terminal subunit|tara:strand:- start:996 stop:2108 length:1113 start_codon:yes stop_codon:yes gene_type:complete
VLARLRQVADGPLSAATAMPPEMYHSEEILHLEQQRMFAHDWVSPGLAAEIPEPGDYLTYSIADQPVFCMRGRDGEIRTFANVCRHRMMQLLDGSGNTGRIVCPYHAWSYDLDGRLAAANHMEATDGFDKADHCLPSIRTEVWNGWIYTTLDPDTPTVAELLAPLDDLVARYRIADYLPVHRADHVWDTNWKFLTENFMEGYHLPVAHWATLGTWMPMDSVVFPDRRHPAFTYQLFAKDERSRYGRAHPNNTSLEGEWRSTTVMPTVFPSHMYILAPDHLWYLSLRPRGTSQVDLRFGIAVAPEMYASLDDPDAWVAETVAFFADVCEEDRVVVEGIHEGSRAPLAVPGPLSWLEHELQDLMGYLADRLA